MKEKDLLYRILLYSPPLIILIFLFLVYFNEIIFHRHPSKQTAMNAKIEIAIENYRAKQGKYPEGGNKDIIKEIFEKGEIDRLSLDKSGNCLDKWGTPMKIYYKDGRPMIISAGPNRKFDEMGSPNDDDIRKF